MGETADNLRNRIGRARDRIENSERREYIDIHCHCLANIDDGPATREASLTLCKALVKDGISTVIATPHQLGRYGDFNESVQIRKQVGILNEALDSNGIDLHVVPGADVRIDERICQLLEADKILTLADHGKHILLELPHQIFIDIEPLLIDLASMGIQAIVSHPERHPVLARRPELLLKWLDRSAYVQVTCASLLGDFGSGPQTAAWNLLQRGWTSFVATDAHNVSGRRPRMKAAYQQISTRMGRAMARLLCIENPLRVLQGRDVLFARDINARTWTDEGVQSRY